MTLLDDIEASLDETVTGDNDDGAAPGQIEGGGTTGDAGDDGAAEPRIAWADVARPLLASGAAAAGSALVVGGIFGSWTARVVGLLAVLTGTGWVFLARRARTPAFTQILLLPALVGVSFFTLIGTSGGGPNELPRLMGAAIRSGRLFRPPVPFDPGWRPLLVLLLGLLAFGAGSLAIGGRPKLGVGITVPLTVLALISQPDNSAFLGGVFAFLPLIIALAILFGDDGARANELSREFEAKRALRGIVAAFVLVAALFGLNRADFLFPKPAYNPNDKPQKPRAVPLSASRDRVLFEVTTTSDITGPWRLGALDVYKDNAFQSVSSTSRLEPLPPDGALSPLRAGETQQEVTIAVDDLGDTPAMPVLAGATRVAFTKSINAHRDPRYDTLRVPTGRVPAGTKYTLSLPRYATSEQLAGAAPGSKAKFADQLAAPTPPPNVQDLLNAAPPSPWKKLDSLRQALLNRVVASGPGTPTDITADRVNRIMAPIRPEDAGKPGKGNEASPFEIVATEALLARWSGVPSRVGFGFDGLNVEGSTFTVRPRNASQWLEVNFDGYGWLPLIGTPNQAKTSLNDQNQKFTPTVRPSDAVAVQVYVLYRRTNIKLLFQRIRDYIYLYGPLVLAALLVYLVYPGIAKLVRARRRRAWAAVRGPLAEIMVEYAEMRDLAIDLNVGDDYDSPLEYCAKVASDEEHEELAWLVTQSLYDELGHELTADDVRTGTELAMSVRRRLNKAQPFQSQALAFISRASIEVPYTDELPNIKVIRVGPIVARGVRTVTAPVAKVARRTTAAVVSAVTWPRRLILKWISPAEGGQT